MTGLVLVAVNVALIALVLRQLLAVGRRLRATAIPYWPESLELPIPDPGRPRARRARR